MANQVAPEGQVWVCAACGKRSKDLYGHQPINRGWDVSCMLNALLCREDSLTLGDDGRVTKVEEGGVVDGRPAEGEESLRAGPEG